MVGERLRMRGYIKDGLFSGSRLVEFWFRKNVIVGSLDLVFGKFFFIIRR